MRPRSSRGRATPRRTGTRLRWVPRPPAGPQTVSARRLLALMLAGGLGLTGCSGGGTPSAPPPDRSAQPAAAVPAVPPPAPPAAPSGVPAPFVYEAKGRRDPFRPLITPRVAAVRARPKVGLAALEVNELKLAGIIWEQRGYFALVEAPTGAGYVLRVNDIVGDDARVAKITADAVTFEVRGGTVASEVRGGTLASQTRTRRVELRLRKEE